MSLLTWECLDVLPEELEGGRLKETSLFSVQMILQFFNCNEVNDWSMVCFLSAMPVFTVCLLCCSEKVKEDRYFQCGGQVFVMFSHSFNS